MWLLCTPNNTKKKKKKERERKRKREKEKEREREREKPLCHSPGLRDQEQGGSRMDSLAPEFFFS